MSKDNKYCCLGVAVDIAYPEWKTDKSLTNDTFYNYELLEIEYPTQVDDDFRNILLDKGFPVELFNDEDLTATLGTLNDGGLNQVRNDIHQHIFSQIADWIEKHVELY